MKKITIDEWLAEFEKINTENDEDEVYKKAVKFVVDKQRAATILLVVGLSISERTATRLLARMELDGVIEYVGSGHSRKVLLCKK